MNRRERRIARIRNEAIRETYRFAVAITDADLRIVKLALEDRERMHAGEPAGTAAGIVRAKLEQKATP